MGLSGKQKLEFTGGKHKLLFAKSLQDFTPTSCPQTLLRLRLRLWTETKERTLAFIWGRFLPDAQKMTVRGSASMG